MRSLVHGGLLLTGMLLAAACGEDGEDAPSAASSSGASSDRSGASSGSSAPGSPSGAPGSASNPGAGAAGPNASGEAGAPPNVPVAGEIDCRRDGDGKTTLAFINRCARAVTFAGSNITGATIEPGRFSCVDVGNATDPINSKRYWGWVGTNPGPERHTLAEFTFNTDFNDFDWYNISHVDAHNLPMSIVPVARPNCKTLSCPQDFLAVCPEAGRVRDSSGAVVSCFSPNRDSPDTEVVRLFEQCNDAYAWSADDANGSDPSPMRACAGEDWDIVFCPPP